MNNILFPIFIFLFYSNTIFSQVDTTYYTIDWEEVENKEHAIYYALGELDIDVKKFYHVYNNSIACIQNLKNNLKHGICEYYDENGKLIYTETYCNDILHGECHYYIETKENEIKDMIYKCGDYIFVRANDEEGWLRTGFYVEGCEECPKIDESLYE